MSEENKSAQSPLASATAPKKNTQLDAQLNAQIDAMLAGRHADPFSLLGPHPAGHGWTIRFFRPGAGDASVLVNGMSEPIPARRLRPEGFFEAALPDSQQAAPAPGAYRIRYRTGYGETVESFDTYAFPYLLSEFDLHLMGEGRHYDTYEKLGAHLKTLEGVRGVHFAVWAPSARRVSVVGDFNRWDGRVNPMRARGSSGIWELFVPELAEGAIYKYEVIGPTGAMLPLKADPYAFRAELRPNTGSVVVNLDTYSGLTTDWINQRAQKNWLESPISVYEVHLGSWRRVPEDQQSLAHLPRTRRSAHSLRQGSRLHPHRTASHHGASLRWLLGLSDDWLFRRHQPLRLSRGIHGIR